MTVEKSRYIENFNQIKSDQVGQALPWLQNLRETAWQDFLQRGFPARREEAWKYTTPSFLEKHFFTLTTAGKKIAPALLQQYHLAEVTSHRIVIVDGYFSRELSTIGELAPGVRLMSLAEAMIAHPEELQLYLAKKATAESHALFDLNTAFVAGGLFLAVAKNVVVKHPLHLLFVTTAENETPLLSSPRNIFILEDNSQVVIFEEHIALEQSLYYKNIVTQIDVKTGAQLEYYKLQNESDEGFHVAVTEIDQAQDSQVHTVSISLGAKLARDDLNINLNKPGSFCHLDGLYLLNGERHIDHHTRIDHRSMHGTSEECYKGILSDRTTAVFNGKVIVHPHAQKTKSVQSNKNLLLSKNTEINTKPELEIYADDVQCAHGATVGQIDAESLFYLRSRGINETAAIIMLVEAFADEILHQIKQPAIEKYLREIVTRKMPAK